MSFSVKNVIFLYLFIPFFMVLLYVIVRYRTLKKNLLEKSLLPQNTTSINKSSRIAFCFWSRTFCQFISGVSLILSLAGVSWGTNIISVQKSGKAVSFVFDISYSMEAKDGPGGISRLKAASFYAKSLLDKMEGTSVSVVLAKGEGIVAVPITEDFQSAENLIDSLSPLLMTASGSSLGSGIRSALSSFPEQSSSSSFIWLFTDGEETDNMLQSSLSECLKYGVSVAIIGFGSEKESEILSGDGVTKIKTALRSDNIKKLISLLKDKTSSSKRNSRFPSIIYIDARDAGSASSLLKLLDLSGNFPSVSYEIQVPDRHSFFIFLSITFFLLSIFLGELNIFDGKKKFFSSFVVASVVFLFSSCSNRFYDGTRIFEGKLECSKKNYQKAVADFLETASNAEEKGDSLVWEYSVYNLGSTYLMQGENDAALLRFSQIYETSDDKIKFALLYNSGIIAHRNGDYESSSSFFKQAILIDGNSTSAKINLELSLKGDVSHSNEEEKDLIPISEVAEDQTLQNELYSVIREDEKQKWKSMQKEPGENPLDY